MPFMGRAFLVRFLRRMPRYFSVAVIMDSVQIFGISPVSRLLYRVHPFLHGLRRIATTNNVVFNRESLFTSVFLNSARYFFGSRLC